MRMSFFIVAAALVVAMPLQAKQVRSVGTLKTATETPVDPVAARKEIETANQNFVIALKKRDAKTIGESFELDAVLMPEGGDALHGREQITKYFETFLAKTTVEDASAMTLDFTVAAHTGYETGLYTMTTRIGNGAAVSDHGKYLCVWKYDDDKKWRITREIFNTSSPLPAAAPQH